MTRSDTSPARVVVSDAAKDDLSRYPHLAARFATRLQTLALRPDRGHPLTGALLGTRALELSRQGGGFRAVYRWDRESNIILVFAIGPHATVYQRATERYLPPAPPAAPS